MITNKPDINIIQGDIVPVILETAELILKQTARTGIARDQLAKYETIQERQAFMDGRNTAMVEYIEARCSGSMEELHIEIEDKEIII